MDNMRNLINLVEGRLEGNPEVSTQIAKVHLLPKL